jgi:Fic family protein
MKSSRAGRCVQQRAGYRAFLPAPLPPKPAIQLAAPLSRLLSEADRALGRLDGVATVLPNTDLFVAMYLRQEAVLSSQIEGTQSTLDDVLAFEAEGDDAPVPGDVTEVVNYVAAMRHGLRRLPELPLSLRLLREIHEVLMRGVRGAEKRPGEFRTTQNWIGAGGCTLQNADFVTPPPHEMDAALGNLELFLHDASLPLLMHVAVAHAQFETIHPFLDGNGRVGRLLIGLLLCERGALRHPLLYLSVYLKAHRAQYYDRLTAIRNDGDWEGWVAFFLRGVAEVSDSATVTARAIVELRETLRAKSLPPPRGQTARTPLRESDDYRTEGGVTARCAIRDCRPRARCAGSCRGRPRGDRAAPASALSLRTVSCAVGNPRGPSEMTDRIDSAAATRATTATKSNEE